MSLIRASGAGLGRIVCRHRGRRPADELERALHAFHKQINNVDFDMTRNGELRVLRTLLDTHPSCLLDVGANVGEWTMLVSKLEPECVVHAFEPVPSTYEKLLQNVAALANVVPNGYGLSSEEAVIPMMVSGNPSDSTAFKIAGLRYHDEHYRNTVECRVRRACDYIAENHLDRVDFVKIDVEGMDLRVIRGFGEQLDCVRALQFEYGVFNISSHDLLADFWEYLSSRGFVVGKVFPRCVRFGEYDCAMENFHSSNYVAVREDEEALIRTLRRMGR